MKYLILIFVLLICSCSSPKHGDVIVKVSLTNNENFDYAFISTNDYVMVPHGLYQAGDTLKFCK